MLQASLRIRRWQPADATQFHPPLCSTLFPYRSLQVATQVATQVVAGSIFLEVKRRAEVSERSDSSRNAAVSYSWQRVIMISLKRKFRTAHHEGKRGCPGASLWMAFSSRVQDGFELPRVKWLIPTHLSGARRR